MLFGRFLVGLGIGVNTVLVPIYISEVIVITEEAEEVIWFVQKTLFSFIITWSGSCVA